METIKQDIAELLSVQEHLNSEQLEKIDFDNLLQQLQKVQKNYEEFSLLKTEHEILKSSLVAKIKTMLKAIAIVTKKRPDVNELESIVQELVSKNSTELLRSFDKTETKFHAAFPSTFHLSYKNNIKSKDYSSYK